MKALRADLLQSGMYRRAIRAIGDAHMHGIAMWLGDGGLRVRLPNGKNVDAVISELTAVAEALPDLLPDPPPVCAGCGGPIDVDATNWQPVWPMDGLVHSGGHCFKEYAVKTSPEWREWLRDHAKRSGHG